MLPNAKRGAEHVRLASERCLPAIVREPFKLDGNFLIPAKARRMPAYGGLHQQAFGHF